MPRGPETQIYSIQRHRPVAGGDGRDHARRDAEGPDPRLRQAPAEDGRISHCFRTEAGGHGKQSRGIYRVHQFTKIEMFGFTPPSLDASNAFHQMVLGIEEQLFQGLQVPYRVIDTCTGDSRWASLSQVRPGGVDAGAERATAEITSASNCTRFSVPAAGDLAAAFRRRRGRSSSTR